MECISLVGMAVGKERFRGDAHEVMKFMKAYQDQVHHPHFATDVANIR